MRSADRLPAVPGPAARQTEGGSSSGYKSPTRSYNLRVAAGRRHSMNQVLGLGGSNAGGGGSSAGTVGGSGAPAASWAMTNPYVIKVPPSAGCTSISGASGGGGGGSPQLRAARMSSPGSCAGNGGGGGAAILQSAGGSLPPLTASNLVVNSSATTPMSYMSLPHAIELPKLARVSELGDEKMTR